MTEALPVTELRSVGFSFGDGQPGVLMVPLFFLGLGSVRARGFIF